MSGAKGNTVFFTLVPIVSIVIALFSIPFIRQLPLEVTDKIPYLPYIIILGVLLMGSFFSRHRITFISISLGLAYFIIQQTIASTDIGFTNNIILVLVMILLPLNIALLTGLKEQQLLSVQGVAASALIILQILISYWLIQNYMGLLVEYLLFTPEFLKSSFSAKLSLAVYISFAMSFIIILVHLVKRKTVFEYSFMGALLAIIIYFHSDIYQSPASIFVALAALIIAWGLTHNSYLIAYIDELTELPGRRAMNEQINRLRGNYAIAMLDIDHFKKFNDTYGHDIGDQVLKMVATKIGEIGGGGKPFRYGGEEFAIIFPNKNSKTAFPYLSNLRETVDQASLILRNQDRPSKKPDKIPPRKVPWQEVHVTISIGVANTCEELITADEILKAADEALYRSKEKGRNRISQYSTKDYVPELEDEDDE